MSEGTRTQQRERPGFAAESAARIPPLRFADRAPLTYLLVCCFSVDSPDQVAPTPPPPPSSASPVDESLVMRTQSGLALHMHPEVWGRWSMTDYAAIKVRSKEYVQSGVKIPPPCPPTMEIIQLEIWQCEKQVYHVCSYKDNWLRKFKAAQAAAGAGKPRVSPQPSSSPSRSSSPPSASSNASSASSASSSSSSAPRDLSSGAGLRPFDDDFFFVAHFCVQTNPTYHLTMYFQRREVARANGQQQAAASPPAASASASASPSSPSSPTLFFDEEKHEPRAAAAAKQSFDTLFSRFINASTEWRNSRLKLIPFVVDGGNWFVQKTVGQRPAIIGRKIDTKYYCDPELNYMEVRQTQASRFAGLTIARPRFDAESHSFLSAA